MIGFLYHFTIFLMCNDHIFNFSVAVDPGHFSFSHQFDLTGSRHIDHFLNRVQMPTERAASMYQNHFTCDILFCQEDRPI